MHRQGSTLNATERDPLLPRSRYGGMNLFGTMRYHVIIDEQRQRAYYCGCCPGFREQRAPCALGPKRRKEERWAADFRYRWRRRK